MNNADKSASPVENCIMDNSGDYTGLTKRETFAMAAMQGILSHSFGRGNPEECAIAALQNADALLKELEKS